MNLPRKRQISRKIRKFNPTKMQESNQKIFTQRILLLLKKRKVFNLPHKQI